MACEDYYLTGFIHTAFMIGGILSFFGGMLSDHLGRKIACITLSVLLTGTIVISEILIQKINFSIRTQYIIYFISQLLVGIFSNAVYIVAYVLFIEIFPIYIAFISITFQVAIQIKRL